MPDAIGLIGFDSEILTLECIRISFATQISVEWLQNLQWSNYELAWNEVNRLLKERNKDG